MAKPEMSFKNGGCRASIFVTEFVADGKTIQKKKAVVSRTYKDKEGNWKDTNSFEANDIPKAILVMSKAYDYLTSKDDSLPGVP